MRKTDRQHGIINENIYLKSILITVNGKFYRKYLLDYHNEHNTGTLIAISEFFPNSKGESNKHNVINNSSEIIEENLFSFDVSPDADIKISGYYTSHYPQTQEIPIILQAELNNNLWSFHAVDFSGMGSTGLPGQYFYNWYNNQAFLNFNTVAPELLSTIVIILLQYHKTIYQLMTEINIFMAMYSHPASQNNQYMKNSIFNRLT